jgi:hypothetical protein
MYVERTSGAGPQKPRFPSCSFVTFVTSDRVAGDRAEGVEPVVLEKGTKTFTESSLLECGDTASMQPLTRP